MRRLPFRLLSATLLLAFGLHAAHAKPLAQEPISTDFVQGSKDAPVTLIEYASLSCQHCAHFHKQVVGELVKRYIDTGKLRYILRPFPLNDPALKASLLIDCVGEEQGDERYYTFARVLFDAQNKWAFDTTWLNSLETFAKVGGVGRDMFDRCLNDSAREIKVLNIKRAAATELSVDRTPYIFLNGMHFEGDPTLENISAAIDAELSKLPTPEGKQAPQH